VPAAANCDGQRVVASKPNCRLYVGDGPTSCDARRTSIDHAIPNSARRVEVSRIRTDELTTKPATELAKSVVGQCCNAGAHDYLTVSGRD
jgi:hypothetical protein